MAALTDESASSSRRREAMALAAVLCAVALTYLLFGWGNGFLWLDQREILDGGLIVEDWAGLWGLLTNDRNYGGYHRPVYNLLHSLDWWLWGERALGYHLSSLALHLANVALVFRLCRTFGMGRDPALVLVLLWGLHPLGTVAVGLIHAKADLFTVTALGASLLLAMGAGRPPRAARLAAAWTLFALALYTKESAYAFPIGLLLLARPLGRRAGNLRPYLAGVLALTVAAGIHRWGILDVESYASPLSLPERLATFAGVYVDYARRIALPLEPSVADTVTTFGALPLVERARSLLIFGALAGFQSLALRRAPASRAWILIANLSLLPVAQIVPILHFRADRFLYLTTLAALGLALQGALYGARRLDSRGAVGGARLRPLLGVGVTGLALAYGALDARALRGFESDETLFARELARNPCYLEGLSHLARRAELRGELERAEALYRSSLEPCPGTLSFVERDVVLLNLSSVLLRRMRWQDAYSLLQTTEGSLRNREALRLSRHNRAVAAHKLGAHAEALELFEEFLREFPHHPSALFLGGMSAYQLGEHERANELLSRYLEAHPSAEDRPLVEEVLRDVQRF